MDVYMSMCVYMLTKICKVVVYVFTSVCMYVYAYMRMNVYIYVCIYKQKLVTSNVGFWSKTAPSSEYCVE